VVDSKWPYVDYSFEWDIPEDTCYICHQNLKSKFKTEMICKDCLKRDSEYAEKMKLKIFRRPQAQKGISKISVKEKQKAFDQIYTTSFYVGPHTKESVLQFMYPDSDGKIGLELRCLMACFRCRTEYDRIVNEWEEMDASFTFDELVSEREKEFVKRYTKWFLSHQNFDEDVELDFYRVIIPKPEVQLLCVDCSKDYVEISTPKDNESDNLKRSRRIPTKVQDQVWRRDEGRCVQCGSNENLEFDHIIPFSRGGSNTKRNVQLLCETCNRKKSGNIGF